MIGVVQVDVPTELTERAKKLVLELDEEMKREASVGEGDAHDSAGAAKERVSAAK